MLEIKLSAEKKKIAEYCKKRGVFFDDAFYLYLAKDKGAQLAACLFEVLSDSVTAVYYECADPSDYWLFDGMLRAGFNYASEQGITTGVLPESFWALHRGMFAKLNYPAAPEFNITNFFQKYKNCK